MATVLQNAIGIVALCLACKNKICSGMHSFRLQDKAELKLVCTCRGSIERPVRKVLGISSCNGGWDALSLGAHLVEGDTLQEVSTRERSATVSETRPGSGLSGSFKDQ